MIARSVGRSWHERLAEADRLIVELTGQIERHSARVEELEQQARKDSST